MEIERLNEFVLLARRLSFRQTAAELGISPSLLSTHLHGLEESLGVRLLDRDAHSVVLTDEGRRFLSGAQAVVQNYQQTLEQIRSIEDNTVRSLRIGLCGTVLPGLLGPYLDSLILQQPALHLELHDDGRHSIARSISDGSLDLFFSYAMAEAEYPGIDKEALFQTPLCALLPLSHPLAGRSKISMQELSGETFILYPETAEPAVRELQQHILALSGIPCTIYEEPVSPRFYQLLVPIGKGIAFFPWVLQQQIPPNTVPVVISDLPCPYTMYTFCRRFSSNPIVPAFLQGLRSFEPGARR
jgi:DNA-binding transcriptional LysR family regulator